jgi:hypothetical protein
MLILLSYIYDYSVDFLVFRILSGVFKMFEKLYDSRKHRVVPDIFGDVES